MIQISINPSLDLEARLQERMPVLANFTNTLPERFSGAEAFINEQVTSPRGVHPGGDPGQTQTEKEL